MTVELIDASTGEVVHLDQALARKRADQIKAAVEGTWHLIEQAYLSRDWLALGYASWDDYCTREFGTSRLRLPREDREEVVSSLRESGLSIRAITAATGDGYGTVRRALGSGEPNGSPEPETEDEAAESVSEPEPSKVVGIDGKTYKGSKSQPRAQSPKANGTRRVKRPVGDDARLDRLAELAAQGWTSDQIGRDLGHGETYIRLLARNNNIKINADAVMGRRLRRPVDHTRIVQETVNSLAGMALGLKLLNLNEADLSHSDEWVTSLSDSLRALNRFHNQLKEATQ